MALDRENEKLRGAKSIGTTGRGIGLAYCDKIGRTGIRMADLLQPAVFKEKLKAHLFHVNFLLENLYKAESFKIDDIYDEYTGYVEKLSAYIADTDIIVNRTIAEKGNVLFEGAQGTMLDIDHGTYPFVTSSNAIAGGACTGLGVGPTKISRVRGVVKAYTTRVGSGPFPTEIRDGLGDMLREKSFIDAVPVPRSAGVPRRIADAGSVPRAGMQACRPRGRRRGLLVHQHGADRVAPRISAERAGGGGRL